MQKSCVFIDGSAGTTGLRIYERLSLREDIELITLKEEERKDTKARQNALNSADIAILCLPDAAAIEAVSLVTNENTKIIDASTAHRTAAGWAYGFPELSPEFEEKISSSKRIAVPGCHASGFIALVYPLIASGLLPSSAHLCCHSLTGYSGGGKSMIGEYEGEDKNKLLYAPRQYGISQTHKHLKEMKAICKLGNAPMFSPIVDDFYSGMEVTLQLFADALTKSISLDELKEVYKKTYNTEIVSYSEEISEDGFLSAMAMSGKDSMKIAVFGNDERFLPVALYDNLGKGASGAAIECMNILLGKEKALGLNI